MRRTTRTWRAISPPASSNDSGPEKPVGRGRHDEPRNQTVGTFTQSHGVHGHEIVYPADCFTVMKNTLAP
ncbi:hypothetical protein LZ199_13890 [Myxococcus sp. QH3KD-4-1]|nr:hypothetical protein [Myxococcus qinghaiensis]